MDHLRIAQLFNFPFSFGNWRIENALIAKHIKIERTAELKLQSSWKIW